MGRAIRRSVDSVYILNGSAYVRHVIRVYEFAVFCCVLYSVGDSVVDGSVQRIVVCIIGYRAIVTFALRICDYVAVFGYASGTSSVSHLRVVVDGQNAVYVYLGCVVNSFQGSYGKCAS